MISLRRLSVLAWVLSGTLSGGPAFAALTRIGAAAAVAGVVNAQSEGEAVGHVLSSGKPIFLNDHVTSDSKGRLQVMLLDETVFTLGPNADMVLDKFIYDPGSEGGEVAATVKKGAFRFVTGRIAAKDPTQMRVKVGTVGTIGIRGTVVAGNVVPNGQSLVVLLGPGVDNTAQEKPGAIRVDASGSAVNIGVAGVGTILEPGKAPSPPFVVPAAMLAPVQGALAAEPAADKQESGGSSSQAEKQSGQEASSAIVAIKDSASSLDAAAASAAVTTLGSQTGASSITTTQWDAMKGLAGTTYFATPRNNPGMATYSCTGGCTGGTWHWHLFVDFSNRVIGGRTQTATESGSHIQFNSGSLSGSEYPIGPASFNSLSGDAVIRLGEPNMPSIDPKFSGTTITIRDHGDAVAADAMMDMKYNGGSFSTSATKEGVRDDDGFVN